MRLAFVDIVYGYTADRPDTDAPLGGTTSAVCFLARELAKAGITCDFFNTVSAEGTAHNIRTLPLERLIMELGVYPYDAVIFCGRWMEGMVHLVRQATKAPLIAWMHESIFNPKLVPVVDVFDAVVFVSEWQQRINRAQVPSKWKQIVLRNAMNPKAAGLFAGHNILSSKTKPPVLLYAGNAARGVFHLPPILDRIRKNHTDFTIEIFSSTNPSGHAEQDAKYIGWLQNLPNVAHVGMTGQDDLIEHMKRAAIMVMPNPWPETSCIAMIEAMACGLSVVATNRAALPETASGFARLVTVEDADHSVRFDMPVPHEAFATVVSAELDELQKHPGIFEEKRIKQIEYFNAHYRWVQRVAPWIEFIKGLV